MQQIIQVIAIIVKLCRNPKEFSKFRVFCTEFIASACTLSAHKTGETEQRSRFGCRDLDTFFTSEFMGRPVLDHYI